MTSPLKQISANTRAQKAAEQTVQCLLKGNLSTVAGAETNSRASNRQRRTALGVGGVQLSLQALAVVGPKEGRGVRGLGQGLEGTRSDGG